jgi:hypothetical protein
MQYNKKKIPIHVIYHCTEYVPFKTFLIFVNNYKKYSANYKHKLIICFKNLDSKKIIKYTNELVGINYIKFIDKKKINDFDIGSYRRIAKKYRQSILIFLSGHSYPVVKNWLKILMRHFKTDRIIATSASYESMRDLPFNLRNNFIKNFYQKIIFLKNFSSFPNPHFRTTGYVISANNFLKYPFKKIETKNDTHLIESGRNSMYQFYKKLKIETFLVNSDGKIFDEKNWKKSKTYAFGNQKKLIISDSRTRQFDKLKKTLKSKKSLLVWG